MPPKRSQPPAKMSLEAALDEERREILDILEGRKRPSQQQPQSRRHDSPAPPPVRSMLDIPSGPAPPRHGSIAGVGVGVTAPGGSRPGTAQSSSSSVRSMIDPPRTQSPLRSSHSATSTPTSPVESNLKGKEHEEAPRRASDTASNGLPEMREKYGVDINQDYQFDMLPSIPHHALPKRAAQGGKKNKHGKGSNNNQNSGGSGRGGGDMHHNSMAAVMSGSDLGPLPGYSRGRDAGRHNSSSGPHRHSKSPSSRLGRSRSPGGSLLNHNSFNPMSTPGKWVTDSGKVINMDHAYRRLSNAALSMSGGSLANLPKRGSGSRERGESVDSTFSEPDARLPKDYYSDTADGGESDSSPSDEEDDTSGGEEDSKSESQRGRRLSREKSDTADGKDESGKIKLKTRSLLAAAEEERQTVSYKVKSLLDAPAVEKAVNKKTSVHPHTSFDHAASAGNTPVGSDDEAEYSDIKKAQNLAIYTSPVDQSVPNRVIRTIIRGDFTEMQREADEGRQRLRSYLVATDLSEESAYALEWTIGTILRDGDTLYAVYAVDAETGTGKGSGMESSSSLHISDGTKAMLDITSVVGSQTEKTAGNIASKFTPAQMSHGSSGGSESKPGSVDSRAQSKSDLERSHAIESITQTCIKLLRKTRLQVRVAIEVIHCKNPKHLITEAIDGLEPTLVILGSRGRSALKGVLLGSFSNYLVTKSSVPVMVARKKLRQHTKYNASNARLSNNLTTPKKLANAKVD